MFNMHVLLPCADFTCLLLFFSSEPFLLSHSEQTEAAVQDLPLLLVHPISCYTACWRSGPETKCKTWRRCVQGSVAILPSGSTK